MNYKMTTIEQQIFDDSVEKIMQAIRNSSVDQTKLLKTLKRANAKLSGEKVAFKKAA